MEISTRTGFFTQLHEYFQTQKGKRLQITERITTRNYDRHATTINSFSFELQDVATRISGARLILLGKGHEQYELSLLIDKCDINADQITVEESFSSDSVIKRLSEIIIL